MASVWGSSWGSSWGNSWGEAGVVEPPVPDVVYVNETVTYTPRHQRIGGAVRPPEFPQLPPIFGVGSSGQAGQTVSAKARFSIRGASQGSAAVAEFSVESEVSIKQLQSAKSDVRLKVMASVRAKQSPAGSSGQGRVEIVAVVKSGGEALMVPTYAGEETPDAFFESVDRAA